jgi:hypothetical protein
MFWRRLITTWLCLVMVLLGASPASAASSAQAKPHQGSAEPSAALHIWLEASASAGVHTGNQCLSDADTSDVPHAARGATLEKLTAREILRIQNAATRSGTEIAVVGSRVNPNKALTAASDYDYVISANSATRRSLSGSLPGAKNINEGIPGNLDIFKGPVDSTLPFVIFFP